MKRLGFFLSAALALFSLAPGHADPPFAGGSIRFPAPSSSVERIAYQNNLGNGLFGYVVSLTGNWNNKTYTLTSTGGAPGSENLDVLFYYDLNGNGAPCSVGHFQQSGNVETGTACPGDSTPAARYAIVYMQAGANASFTLTV